MLCSTFLYVIYTCALTLSGGAVIAQDGPSAQSVNSYFVAQRIVPSHTASAAAFVGKARNTTGTNPCEVSYGVRLTAGSSAPLSALRTNLLSLKLSYPHHGPETPHTPHPTPHTHPSELTL